MCQTDVRKMHVLGSAAALSAAQRAEAVMVSQTLQRGHTAGSVRGSGGHCPAVPGAEFSARM